MCTMREFYKGTWTTSQVSYPHYPILSSCDNNVGFLEQSQKYQCELLNSTKYFNIKGCEFIRQRNIQIFMIGDSLMAQLYLVPQTKGCRNYVRNDFLTENVPNSTIKDDLFKFYNRTIPMNEKIIVANSGAHYNWLKSGDNHEIIYIHMLHELHKFSTSRSNARFIWLPIPIPPSEYKQDVKWNWESFHYKNKMANNILKRFYKINYRHIPTTINKHDGIHWCQNGPVPRHLMELVNHISQL